MFVHEIGVGRDDDGVGAVVAVEAVVNCLQLFPDFDAGVLGMISVEGPVGGQDEEEVAIVSREVLVAEIVGVLVAEVGPHRNVHLLLQVNEQVRKELVLALAIGDVEAVVGVSVYG